MEKDISKSRASRPKDSGGMNAPVVTRNTSHNNVGMPSGTTEKHGMPTIDQPRGLKKARIIGKSVINIY